MKSIKLLFAGGSRRYCNVAQNKINEKLSSSLISQESHKNFQNSLPIIINKVFTERPYWQSSGVADHVKKIIDYNLKGGKYMRGALTLHTYQTLDQSKNVTEQTLHQAHVLAWAAEMVQSCFIISDDIEDETKTRRGKPCWHMLPDVGNNAVNDIIILRSFLEEMLKTTFEHNPMYTYIVDLFHKAFTYTAIGQYLDFRASKAGNRDYSHFTIDLYHKIIRYKTGFYSFELPILLGMALIGRNDKESQKYVEDICTGVVRIFQMQDDYLDCYGDKNVIGKTGTDIQEGKCSWLAVAAQKRCSKPQRIVFQACYGSNEPAHMERIKCLYDKLQIPQVYAEQEKSLYNSIVQQTRDQEKRQKIPAELFINLLNSLYKRKL